MDLIFARVNETSERQVELFEMHCFTMFIIALCVIFLMRGLLALFS